MEKRLEGKVAIITGAGRGIARGIAKDFGLHGAKVICVDYGVDVEGNNPDAAIAEVTAQDIRAEGGEAIGLFADVGNFADGERMVQCALDTYGKLDCLINVAGILRERMVFNMTEDEWDAVIRVHLKGTFVPTKFASIYWRQSRNGGRLVSTSSSAFMGSAGQPNYAAAKAGIVGFTYSCAQALARYDVTANALTPGAATRMTDRGLGNAANVRQGGRPPSETAEGSDRDPRNNAPCVVYLCSDEGRYISGHIFSTGGRSISLWSKWGDERAIFSRGPWDYDHLFRIFRTSIGEGLVPPESPTPGRPGAGGGGA